MAGRRFCLAASQVLMLFICGLVFQGAWEQSRINWDTTSAVMETSMAWFYGCGVVFAVLGVPVLLLNLWRLLTGRLDESELIGIRESEDVPHGDARP